MYKPNTDMNITKHRSYHLVQHAAWKHNGPDLTTDGLAGRI